MGTIRSCRSACIARGEGIGASPFKNTQGTQYARIHLSGSGQPVGRHGQGARRGIESRARGVSGSRRRARPEAVPADERRARGSADAHRKCPARDHGERSEEHTSELQSLMRISYAVFCLKKKKQSTYNETAI